MIEYNNCKLYNLRTKKQLAKFLGNASVSEIKKQSFFVDKIKPTIIDEKRLIEAPAYVLKKMQLAVLKDLRKLKVPENIFSGIKKRSYVNNVMKHCGIKYFMKIDLSKFFPHITRDKVYNFYKNKFNIPSDLANILTNLSTIDFERIQTNKFTSKQLKNFENAKKFMSLKNIKVKNHLITGSRISPILSYLINEDMFSEIEAFCKERDILFTLYIDDMGFSSTKKLTTYHKQTIFNIIKKYGYIVNKQKTKIIDRNNWKRITGGIINSDGSIKCPKNLELKLKEFNQEFIDKDYKNIKQLHGLLIVMSMIQKDKYKWLYGIVHNKFIELYKKNTFKSKSNLNN